MPLSPWLMLRQARDALRLGRPDEAHRLLAPLVEEGYRKAAGLMRDVAKHYVQRAQRHLRSENVEGAWQDLLSAESLDAADPQAGQLRQTLTRLALAECRAALEAGNPVHALNVASRLRERLARPPELDKLESAAQNWLLAAEQADRGDFLLALGNLQKVRSALAPVPATGLDRFAADLADRHERFRVALSHLNDSAENKRYREAHRWAEEAIAAAPDHREARALKAKAWESLQPPGTQSYHPEDTDEEFLLDPAPEKPSKLPIARPAKSTMLGGPGAPLPKRFFLWIDNVGGYLVCLGSRVTFGQAVADGPVDVPLFADLSRLHAELARDGEGYILESARDVFVNGASVPRAFLRPGDRLTLGPTCQMIFHQPVPISPSARLELVSGHRLPLAVDGIILMAESLILGPGPQVHVPLPEAPGNVVLFRQKDGLGVRFAGKFKVDNKPHETKADLPLPSVIVADDFTFALEPTGPRL